MMMKDVFNEKLKEIIENSNDRSVYFTNERYDQIVSEVREANHLKNTKQPLSSKQYRRLKRFDIVSIDGCEKLIEKKKKASSECVRCFCKTDDLFDIIHAAHITTGHKRMRVMEAEINKNYCNVTRLTIEIYLSLCEKCQEKKANRAIKSKDVPLLPNYVSNIISRCQVDLIDMHNEPDGDYNFILNYQDYLSKFTILKPLKTKTAHEVAYNLTDIFCIFGAPVVLQSDFEEEEFANQIIENLVKMWPDLKLDENRNQTQDSLKMSNLEIQNMLVEWMFDNNTKQWSEGLRFIQSKKNHSVHEEMKQSPHKVMFGIGSEPIESMGYSLAKDTFHTPGTLENSNNIPKFCSTCGEYGNLIICQTCDLKLHVKCGFISENQLACSRCNRVCDIRIQQQNAQCCMDNLETENKISIKQEISTEDFNLIDEPDALSTTSNLEQDSVMDIEVKNISIEDCYLNCKPDVISTTSNLEQDSAKGDEIKQEVVCLCKRYCITKRCNCRAEKVKCSSQCHNNRGCKNK